MSKEESELVIANEPETGENTMYIIPSNLSSLKYLSSNSFDFCLIKDCPVTSLTSLSLSQIFRVMKYEGRVEILVSQPITVMQELDSKQIEAHCEHVGFENIATEDAVYTDKKNGKEFPTVVVVCNKPKRNRDEGNNGNIQMIVIKSTSSYNKNKKYGK